MADGSNYNKSQQLQRKEKETKRNGKQNYQTVRTYEQKVESQFNLSSDFSGICIVYILVQLEIVAIKFITLKLFSSLSVRWFFCWYGWRDDNAIFPLRSFNLLYTFFRRVRCVVLINAAPNQANQYAWVFIDSIEFSFGVLSKFMTYYKTTSLCQIT